MLRAASAIWTWILLFLGAPSFSVQQADEGCPLDFGSVAYDEALCSTSLSLCCLESERYLSQVLAVHTNRTMGQPLFLDKTVQAGCVKAAKASVPDAFRQCKFDEDYYTVHGSPCRFGAVGELKERLSRSLVSFQKLLGSCWNLVDEKSKSSCYGDLSYSFEWLSDNLSDTIDVCLNAILISVISTDINNTRWVNSMYDLAFGQGRVNYAVARQGTDWIHQYVTAGLVAAIALVLLMVIAFFVYRHRFLNGEGSKEDKQLLHSEALYAFSRKEIWRATRSFSTQNYLGEGSAGMVHKGVLPSGQLVAVKRIDKEKEADTFFKEVESLSKVRHPNLVSLLGYCQSGENHFLVYEFCSKGNLWQWLFGEDRVLTWEERVNIAVGSAKGLWFLHTNPGGAIIHRDVKPTNILLNDKLEAKLSDFGLSKVITMEESRVYTEVKGTSGYLDPEYMSKGELTLASDIYSFGIVILQLVSGRRPIELEHRYTLIKSAKRIANRRADICKFMDPHLKGKFSEEAARKMIEIAVCCTSQSGNDRPRIGEIKERLQEAWSITNTPVSSSTF